MAIRAKMRQSSTRRRTPAVTPRVARTVRSTRAERLGERHAEPQHSNPKNEGFRDHRPTSHGINGYAKALRFLTTLSDYERLRIVRYNSQNFDLDRMRTLLKKIGN